MAAVEQVPVQNRRAPLTVAQQQLALKCLWMARGIAKRLVRRFPHLRDDLYSAANLALVQAAQTFDPGRGIAFTTFAGHRIAGALIDTMRRQIPLGYGQAFRRHEVCPRVIKGLTEAIVNKGTILLIHDNEPVGDSVEAIEEVERILRKLPRNYSPAMKQIYIHGKNQAESARILGYCQANVALIHNHSMKILAESCKGDH